MTTRRQHTHADATRRHRRDAEMRRRLQEHQDDGGESLDPDPPLIAGGQGRSADDVETQAIITMVIWVLLGLLLAGAAIANWIGG